MFFFPDYKDYIIEKSRNMEKYKKEKLSEIPPLKNNNYFDEYLSNI